MTTAEQIQTGFHRLKQGEQINFAARVESVNEENQTCTVMAAKNEKFVGVRLKSVINNEEAGFYCIPAVGSSVLVSLIGNDKHTAFVSCFGKIEKVIVINESGFRIEMTDEQIYLETGDSSLRLEDGQITFNDGSLNGLVKVDELKTQLDKNSQLLQSILTMFSSWVPVATDGGAALKVLATANLTSKVPGNFSNIENQKIKHG